MTHDHDRDAPRSTPRPETENDRPPDAVDVVDGPVGSASLKSLDDVHPAGADRDVRTTTDEARS